MLRVMDVKIKSGSIMPTEGHDLSVTGGPQRGLNSSSMHSELELLTLDSCRAGASAGEREENLTDSGERNSGNFQPYSCDCLFSCVHTSKLAVITMQTTTIVHPLLQLCVLGILSPRRGCAKEWRLKTSASSFCISAPRPPFLSSPLLSLKQILLLLRPVLGAQRDCTSTRA